MRISPINNYSTQNQTTNKSQTSFGLGITGGRYLVKAASGNLETRYGISGFTLLQQQWRDLDSIKDLIRRKKLEPTAFPEYLTHGTPIPFATFKFRKKGQTGLVAIACNPAEVAENQAIFYAEGGTPPKYMHVILHDGKNEDRKVEEKIRDVNQGLLSLCYDCGLLESAQPQKGFSTRLLGHFSPKVRGNESAQS